MEGAAIVASASGEHTDLLSRVNLFRGLDRVALAKLAGFLEPVAVPARAELFLQGQAGDGLYLISRGRLGVYARASSGQDEVLLHLMGPGEAFGEIALLSDETRTSTVRAEDDSEVLRLPKKQFLELIARDPSVGLAISAALIKRLRTADAARLGAANLDKPISTSARSETAAELLEAVVPEMAGWRSLYHRRSIGLALAALVFVVGWFGVPPPADLGAAGWHVLVSLIAVVPLLAFEAIPDGMVALLLVALWALSTAVPPTVALSGFSTTIFALTVATFAIGAAIASSGLLYRLALWTVARVSSFPRQVVFLSLAGVLVGPAVPSATGRMALVAGAVRELVDALRIEPGSKAAAGLSMAALVGFGQMVAPFLTSSTIALLAFALLPDAARTNLTWGAWAVRAAPLHAILFIGLVVVLLWTSVPPRRGEHPPRPPASSLALQRALLGPVSRGEAIAGFSAIALLLGFATQPLHGIDPAWIGVLVCVAMAATGAMSVETLRSVNWSTVLLLGMLAGVGQVFTATKLDSWLANGVVGSIGGLAAQRSLFVLGLALLCFLLSFVIRWQVAVPVIVVALTPVAHSAGIDPWVVAIVALTASNTFFLPYQSTMYMTLFSGTGGVLFRHAQARPLSLAYAALVLLGLAISVPVWQRMGLL